MSDKMTDFDPYAVLVQQSVLLDDLTGYVNRLHRHNIELNTQVERIQSECATLTLLLNTAREDIKHLEDIVYDSK